MRESKVAKIMLHNLIHDLSDTAVHGLLVNIVCIQKSIPALLHCFHAPRRLIIIRCIVWRLAVSTAPASTSALYFSLSPLLLGTLQKMHEVWIPSRMLSAATGIIPDYMFRTKDLVISKRVTMYDHHGSMAVSMRRVAISKGMYK